MAPYITEKELFGRHSIPFMVIYGDSAIFGFWVEVHHKSYTDKAIIFGSTFDGYKFHHEYKTIKKCTPKIWEAAEDLAHSILDRLRAGELKTK